VRIVPATLQGSLAEDETYIFPISGRVPGIVASKNYLALDGDVHAIDLGHRHQLAIAC
jgi:hypothetical protein